MLRHRIRHRRREEWGSAAVELCLLTPLLIALALLIVLAHRLTTAAQAADTAAHAAARAATLERTSQAARAAAEQAAAETLRTHNLSCHEHALTLRTGGLEPGATVTAELVCRTELADLAGLGVPGSREVSGEASAVVDVYRGRP
ncbi:TadE/TadG family type IV pilus assembly protein [Nocardiopsis composta]|uniref:TadE-like domain-containing protein n=1 Tax=Nocardiopsis composta TaxID=157465 RepID=A0A7W8QGI3_9ACTN|nr:TadE/TadG family type IV pilus assembly protein [Nocardiopsis composta]MBB5429931.1 hypothetical protein [Nocardiopsis composta]